MKSWQEHLAPPPAEPEPEPATEPAPELEELEEPEPATEPEPETVTPRRRASSRNRKP